MLKITEDINLREIYDFQRSFHTPYFFETNFETWVKSFESDIDGAGRTLFKELVAYLRWIYSTFCVAYLQPALLQPSHCR